MSVNLTKGQKVSLSKSGGGGLSRVRMGLAWQPLRVKKMFGGWQTQDVDLDASCLVFNAQGQLIDQIWFRQLQSRDGAIQHTGDNRSGGAGADDESIVVDLSRIHPVVHTLVFVVNSFSGENFSQIEHAVCRLVDETNQNELARYVLSGSGMHNAQVMAKVSRDGQTWAMTAIGAIANGRTFNDLLPAVYSAL